MEARLRFGSNSLGQLGVPDAGVAVSVAFLCAAGGEGADPGALAATARPPLGSAATGLRVVSACGDFEIGVEDDTSASADGEETATAVLTLRQLTAGNRGAAAAPPQVTHVGRRLVAGAVGLQRALFLDAAGDAWTWAGLQPRAATTPPMPPLERLSLPERIAFVACGWHHAALVGASGHAYTVGSNAAGQCGLPDAAGAVTVDAPTRVSAFDGLTAHPSEGVVAAVACGAWHTVFLTRGGDVYTCGSGAHGQLGHDYGAVVTRGGGADPLAVVPALGAVPSALTAGCFTGGGGSGCSERAPRLVEGLPLDDDATLVAAGAAHTLAATRSGRLFVWGRACLPAPLLSPSATAAGIAAATASAPPTVWGLQRYTPTPAVVPLRELLAQAAGGGSNLGDAVTVTSLAGGWMHSEVTVTLAGGRIT